jgi:hypothetical protein
MRETTPGDTYRVWLVYELFRGAITADELDWSVFSGKLRDECLNQEIFYSLKEAQVVVEQ